MKRPAGARYRGNTVRRYLSAYGLLSWRQDTPNSLRLDHWSVRVEGARGLKGNKTPGQVLSELKVERPHATPILIRTVHPEIEKGQATMYVEDLRRIIALIETGKEIR